MSKTALIIADMLNDFIDPNGALFVEPSRDIIPFVVKKAQETRDQGGVVIFVCDAHDPNDREFEQFGAHAMEGTWGSEIIPEIPFLPGDHRTDKTRYNALYNTDLEAFLRQGGATQTELVGVVTSICVLFTSVGLLDRGFPCRVYRDGVADFDPEAHAFALKHMQKLGVEVV